MKLRGYFAISIVMAGLLVAAVFQSLVIVPLIWLLPSRRHRILTSWISFMAWYVTRPQSAIGGAVIPQVRQIPCEPGVLIVMNHQSLMDIPLVVTAVADGYPRILTRRRYARWIPLISQMIRLYQYPIVDPEAKPGDTRKMLKELRENARSSEVPIAIFPEGTRTKDGDIAPFMKTGLRLLLKSRPWKVYVLVADGYWTHPKFIHFINGMATIKGRMELMGPFEWSDTKGDAEAFTDEIQQMMVDRLAEMRGAPAA